MKTTKDTRSTHRIDHLTNMHKRPADAVGISISFRVPDDTEFEIEFGEKAYDKLVKAFRREGLDKRGFAFYANETGPDFLCWLPSADNTLSIIASILSIYSIVAPIVRGDSKSKKGQAEVKETARIYVPGGYSETLINEGLLKPNPDIPAATRELNAIINGWTRENKKKPKKKAAARRPSRTKRTTK